MYISEIINIFFYYYNKRNKKINIEVLINIKKNVDVYKHRLHKQPTSLCFNVYVYI